MKPTDQTDSFDASDGLGASNEPGDPSGGQKILRRIRNELAIETGFIILCLLLAIGLSTKIMLAVVITCLKFALPDFITAHLVYKHDPDRSHGIALAFLFTATGFARASLFAFIALFALILLSFPIFGPAAMGKAAGVGLGTGVICAIGFLFVVFPLTLMATIISWTTKTKLEFAGGLTKLRRSPEIKKDTIVLDVPASIKMLALASGLSLTVVLVSLLTVVESVFLVIAAFIAPFIWMAIFATSVSPRNE